MYELPPHSECVVQFPSHVISVVYVVCVTKYRVNSDADMVI